jgi:hypothetical protein
MGARKKPNSPSARDVAGAAEAESGLPPLPSESELAATCDELHDVRQAAFALVEGEGLKPEEETLNIELVQIFLTRVLMASGPRPDPARLQAVTRMLEQLAKARQVEQDTLAAAGRREREAAGASDGPRGLTGAQIDRIKAEIMGIERRG